MRVYLRDVVQWLMLSGAGLMCGESMLAQTIGTFAVMGSMTMPLGSPRESENGGAAFRCARFLQRLARVAAGLLLTGLLASGQQYVISTFAGGVAPPSPIQLSSLPIGTVWGLAADPAGNVYFSSTALHSVFKVDPTGAATRVAGNGRAGFSGDGGPATSAQLNNPDGIALDNAGNLYIADYNNRRIREVAPDGSITTVAGTGDCCFSGDGGPATSAQLGTPFSVAVDASGNLFIADLYLQRVRKIDASGVISTVAGTGSAGFSGDGGPATLAQLNAPIAVAVDNRGNLFVADSVNNRVREVTPDGIIATIAGTGPGMGSSGDGGPASAATFSVVYNLAIDVLGNLFIVDFGRIREISGGTIATVAGAGTDRPSSLGANLAIVPYTVAADPAGNLFLFDAISSGIFKVGADGSVSNLARGGVCCYSGDGGPATSALLNDPSSVTIDASGNIYIADAKDESIRKVSGDGSITTVATACGYPDDIFAPCGLAVDPAGNFYVSDESGVTKISPSGTRTHIADQGIGLALDPSGNLFIADDLHGAVLEIAPNGVTMTLASGLLAPTVLALDAAGNIYVGDSGNKSIVTLSPSGAVTATIDVSADWTSDFFWLTGLATDPGGNIFFEESFSGEHRVRRIAPDGSISTIAGMTTAGYSGDGGPALKAQLNPTTDELGNTLAIDTGGNLYVVDGENNAVRVLRPAIARQGTGILRHRQ